MRLLIPLARLNSIRGEDEQLVAVSGQRALQGQGLSNATVNSHIASLSGFMTWVDAHAPEAFAGWINEEMEVRRSKIIHVALFNLLKQGAADPKREQDVDRLKRRLENAWEDGQKAGYRDALELFYQRNK